MRKRTITFATSLLACIGWLTCSAQNIPGWSLVWSDEFTQVDGSAPDSTKWGYDTGAGGWGNSELQTYTTSTNNARIEGGQLVIEARTNGSNYTSARLLTKGKWSWTYGRIEGRIKIPKGQGIWPAFWMLGSNIDAVRWPNCGEIDILENIGREPTVVHGTVHGPGYSGGNSIGRPYSLPGNPVFADDFHIYAVEWATNRIKWFVDGQQYFEITPTNLPNGAAWVFNHPHFLLLNVAVGGQWPGNPDGTTIFPQRMIVDYMRAYKLATEPECGGNGLSNPGFETGNLTNWSIYGNSIGNASVASSSSLPVQSGNYVFKLYGQFSGGENYSGLFEDIPSIPGTAYTADGWGLTPIGDQLAGGNTAWIEVSFRDGSGNFLSLYRTALITSGTTAGVWHHLSVSNQISLDSYAVIGSVTNLVAPAGTSFLRYQVVFRQLATASGAALLDDLNLTLPGLTETPVVVSGIKSEAGLSISFPTFSGFKYEVRYKSALNAANWQVLTNLSGNGNTIVVTDTANLNQRFYNVVRVCN